LDKEQRKIGVYKNHFWDFYNKQNLKIQLRIDWTIDLVKTTKIVPKKYFQKLIDTDGLWEIKVSSENNIFRIFCFFDDGNLILLLSGFQKKTQKTPKREIKKAERLKREYYENK